MESGDCCGYHRQNHSDFFFFLFQSSGKSEAVFEQGGLIGETLQHVASECNGIGCEAECLRRSNCSALRTGKEGDEGEMRLACARVVCCLSGNADTPGQVSQRYLDVSYFLVEKAFMSFTWPKVHR